MVIGAGLAGLAAAHELRRAEAETEIWDAGPPGGVIQTERPAPGWIVEAGADGFLGADQDIPTLAQELGVSNRTIGQQTTGSLVWDGRSLTALSSGAAAGLLDIDTRGLDLSAGFASFAGGMGDLVTAMAADVDVHRVNVTAIERRQDGWRVFGADGVTIDTSGVVLALPAYAAAKLIAPLDVASSQTLESVPYYPSANVSLAYRREQVAHPLDTAGFATAPGAAGLIRACTFASSKFAGRAPHDHVLLRAFVSRAAQGAEAHAALAPILGISGAPLWSRGFAWERGIPRYEEGHAERIAAARRRLTQLGPIVLAGAGYDGAGVSACVRSGRAAARELLNRL